MRPRALRRGHEIVPGHRVVSHLGRGSVMDAYEVWSEARDCVCVAKTLRPDWLERTWGRQALLREGRLLRRFTHPHIVRLYELHEDPYPVLILEALTGATLERILEDTPRLPLAELRELGLQVCSAIHYVHRHGYLHLDLKPGNIVAELGQAKLIDFSLARRPGRSAPGLGTRPYLAPEQARGGRVDRQADVWAIGAVLWEAAAGVPLYEEDGGEYPQLTRSPSPVARQRRLPRDLGEAIDAALALDPEGRPTVAALRSALAAR